jgi:Tfp pilus assembly protein PilE
MRNAKYAQTGLTILQTMAILAIIGILATIVMRHFANQ